MCLQSIVDTIKENRKNMWIVIGDFLDYFYYAIEDKDRQTILDKEPDWFDDVGKYEMTFISAMVNKLAVDYNLVTPNWVYKDKYFELKEPHFAMDAKGDLKLVLLVESPK